MSAGARSPPRPTIGGMRDGKKKLLRGQEVYNERGVKVAVLHSSVEIRTHLVTPWVTSILQRRPVSAHGKLELQFGGMRPDN